MSHYGTDGGFQLRPYCYCSFQLLKVSHVSSRGQNVESLDLQIAHFRLSVYIAYTFLNNCYLLHILVIKSMN